MATRTNLHNLVGVLAARHPEVVLGERFLERTLIAEGLCFSTSPASLRTMFSPFGGVDASVLVRDGGTGERVGLVVFSDGRGCSAAASAPPLARCYRRLIPASSLRCGPNLVEKSVEDAEGRRPMADLLSSTLPPTYQQADSEEDLHLRCVFLRATQDLWSHRDGALRAFHMAVRDQLGATGNVSAIILRERSGVATVVLEEAVDTEGVARASSALLETGICVYDSSLFPIRHPAEANNGGGLMLRFLPVFCHGSEYRGRVVILRGLDMTTWRRDAGLISEAMQRHLCLHRLEALLVHRDQGLAVAVIGSRDEALAILQEAEESWADAFGQPIFRELMDAGQFPTDLRAQAPEFRPHADVFDEATRIVEKWIWFYLRRRAAGDAKGLVRGLAAEIALFKPQVIRASEFGSFADRAVLLTGVTDSATESVVGSVMSRFGGFSDCVLFVARGVALVAFSDSSVAARVLREPMERWAGCGFRECQPAPGAEEANGVADRVLSLRLQAVDWVYLSRRWADEPWQREICIRMLELLDIDEDDLI